MVYFIEQQRSRKHTNLELFFRAHMAAGSWVARVEDIHKAQF